MDGFVVVIVVVALLFGASAIPKVARGVASAKKEFEKGLRKGSPAEPARHVVDSE